MLKLNTEALKRIYKSQKQKYHWQLTPAELKQYRIVSFISWLENMPPLAL